jgi:hypothetical protein
VSDSFTNAAMARWRGIVATIEQFTDDYLANPEQLALDHLQVDENPFMDEIQPSPFGREAYRPQNRRAAIMRAVAKRDVPAEFRWTVQEAIGGGAWLVLLNWIPPGAGVLLTNIDGIGSWLKPGGEQNATEEKDTIG